jgi:hypothetical protein
MISGTGQRCRPPNLVPLRYRSDNLRRKVEVKVICHADTVVMMCRATYNHESRHHTLLQLEAQLLLLLSGKVERLMKKMSY